MRNLEGWQRVGPLVEMPAVLRSHGIDPGSLLSRVGLATGALDDPGNMLPFRAVGALFEASVEATGCPHVGLLTGGRAQPGHFGLVGQLVQHAPTLAVALVDLAENQQRYVRGSAIHVVKGDGSAMLTYSVHVPGLAAVEQVITAAVASGFAMLKAVSGLAPVDVWLPFAEPADVGPYQRLFGLRPHFEVPVAGLEFDMAQLAHPLPESDPAIRARLQSEVARYWAIAEPDTSNRVARAIAARLCTGDAGKATISKALGMHPRTLSRRLLEEGTNFRAITRDVQVEIASQLLSGTCLSVGKIGEALGYSDPGAFVRAFQGARGLPPGEWRARGKRCRTAP